MHITNGKQYFTYIEHAYVITKSTILPQSVKEFATRTVLEYHINENIVLKCCF